MKAFALIARALNGEHVAVADCTSAAVLNAAKAARASGELGGKRIAEGIVLSSQSFAPLMTFRCDQPVEQPKAKSKKG